MYTKTGSRSVYTALTCYSRETTTGHYAGVVKLANTLDLGSSSEDCGFESHHQHLPIEMAWS